MGDSLCIIAKELQIILKQTAEKVPFYRALFRGETMGTKNKAHKAMVNVCPTLEESRTIQLLPATAMLSIP